MFTALSKTVCMSPSRTQQVRVVPKDHCFRDADLNLVENSRDELDLTFELKFNQLTHFVMLLESYPVMYRLEFVSNR